MTRNVLALQSVHVPEFETIDCHVHLWRTVDHERQALPLRGRRDRDRWGTPETAIRQLDRDGISKLVFLNVMPTLEMTAASLSGLPSDLGREARTEAKADVERKMVDRIQRQNTWACEVGEQYGGRLVPFIGVQTLLGSAGAAEEVRRGHARGAKGVKIQPGMNGYFPADRTLWPMYGAAEELGMPILADSGTYGAPAPDGTPYGEPVNFAEVLEVFPRLTLVMAHFPSAYWDERVDMAARYPNLQFDVSGGFAGDDIEGRDGRRALAEEDAVRVMRNVGIERFMFGTDGPSVMPQPYIEQVLALDLTDEEKALLLAGNCKRIYAIT